MYTVGRESSRGIILRSFLPERRSIIILDATRGKISCVPSRRRSTPFIQGACAEYQLERWRDTFLLNDIEPVALPAAWVLNDIFFLHGLLELCSAHLVVGDKASAIFSLMLLLYKTDMLPKEPRLSKKIFICKILYGLGIYPPESRDAYTLPSFLISCKDDGFWDFYCNETDEKKLTTWLFQSLQTAQIESQIGAPLNKSFTCKVIPFFKALDRYDEHF